MSAPSLSLRAELSEIPRLAAWVEQVAAGLEARRLYAVQLCLEEVVANLALHARPAAGVEVSLTVTLETAPLRVTVDDDAIPFDPIQAASPAPATTLEAAVPGGLGLTLLRGFSTAQEYARVAGRNRLTLEFA